MAPPSNPNNNNGQNIAEAVQEISERASLLVREEIELAKAEVKESVTKIAQGAAIGAAAGVFILVAFLMILHGLAWLAWWALPVGGDEFFWGFFFVAGIFLVIAGIAGFVAAKLVKSGQSPAPTMAITEAQRIKDTVQEAANK